MLFYKDNAFKNLEKETNFCLQVTLSGKAQNTVAISKILQVSVVLA